MSNIVTESIMTIAIIIAASMVATTMVQSLYGMEINSRMLLDTAKDSFLVKLKIIFATNTSSNELKIWVKNIGKKEIDCNFIERFAIFLGGRGVVKYMPFGGPSRPFWNYSIINHYTINDNMLNPYETLEITAFLDGFVDAGDWYIRIITPLGGVLEYEFSIGG